MADKKRKVELTSHKREWREAHFRLEVRPAEGAMEVTVGSTLWAFQRYSPGDVTARKGDAHIAHSSVPATYQAAIEALKFEIMEYAQEFATLVGEIANELASDTGPT